MVDHESAHTTQPTQTEIRSGTVTHRLTSSTLAIYKAVLALDTILTEGDKRWLLYVQSGWLLARPLRWTAQSNSCEPRPSSPTNTPGEEKAVRAFKESDIHGICVNDRKSFTSGECDCPLPTRVCVYGDHSFRVFEACTSSQKHISFRSVCEEQVLDDWIMTARILTDGRIALVSAHNRLCLFNADASVCYSTISCKDFHILYSAFIHEEGNSDTAGAHNGQLVIFGGTVFNYLSIWSPEMAAELPLKMSCATLHKLQGHSGVIFDVKYDGSQQLLCSTSDDRSCRIYRVGFSSPGPDQRIGRQKWAAASFQLLQAVFGHEARVWRVLILADLRLLTIGEDLRLCLWNAADCGLIKQWSGQHSGLNIWSVTAVQVNQDWVEIFTGGADGSIVRNGFSTLARSNGGMMGGDTRSSVAPSSRRVRHVAIMEEGQLLVVVDGGLLYSVQVARGQWTLRWQDAALKQCVALISDKRLRKTAIVTCTGLAAIYDADHTAQMKWLVDLSCHCLQALWINGTGQNAVSLLVSGPCQVVHLLAYDSAKALLEKAATVSIAQNVWMTAAAQVEHVLICGDRAGSLRVFQLEEGCWQEREVLLHVHGDSQVCQVEDSSEGVVVTAGRSGQVICWRLRGARLDKLRVMQVDKSIIEWLSGFVLLRGKMADLVVLGFRGRKFVALAMAGQEKVMEVDCGGAHRSNDWAYFAASALARFAFVKTNSVNWRDAHLLCRAAAQRPSLVRVGLHGMQIWSAGCLQAAQGGGWTLATASEDTSIKIWTVWPLDDMTADVASPKGLTALLATAQQHLSSVRVLKQSLLMPNSVYSGGGRGQLLLWRCADSGLWTENVSVAASWSLYGDIVRKRWSDQAILQPDTRIMDLDVVALQQVELCAAASSDGRLRFFLNCPHSQRWLLPIGQTSAFPCCLLQVRLLQWETFLWVLSTGTDGLLTIVDITHLMAMHNGDLSVVDVQKTDVVMSRRLHQSGIGALDLRWLPHQGRLHIASGGDDGAICLLALHPHQKALQEAGLICDSAAHTTQISGLSWLSSSRVVSVAKDQLVKLWKVDWRNGTIELQQWLFTCVSDVSCLSVCQGKGSRGSEAKDQRTDVLVAGAGFELLRLEGGP